MFASFIIFLILALIAGIVWFVLRRAHRKNHALWQDRVADIKEANDKNTRGYTTLPDAPSKLAQVIFGWAAIALAAVAVLFFIFGSFYTQDAGESVLQKDVTGNIVGYTTETGLHGKAPWVDTSAFNIRNQQVIFAKASKDGDNQGTGEPDGPEITAADKDGVSLDIDVSVRYSIQANKVTNIYKSFKSEDDFKKSFIFQDIRAAVRQAPNSFKTIEVLNQRAKVEAKIKDLLEKRWSEEGYDYGVSVDSVSLQETTYDDSVKKAYNDAQKAQIQVAQEQSKLDAAKISAQQAVVNAEAQAKANKELNASLTPQILQQQYLDALKAIGDKGNLVVVPNGSTPFVQVTK